MSKTLQGKYAERLEKENKKLKDKINKAIEYIKENNMVVVNKEYLPDGISTMYDYELLEILGGTNE